MAENRLLYRTLSSESSKDLKGPYRALWHFEDLSEAPACHRPILRFLSAPGGLTVAFRGFFGVA